MDVTSILFEVMKQYQKRLGIFSEIYRLTQEIDQLLAANDRGSSQLVLQMRQEEMDLADQCGEDLAYLQNSLERDEYNRLMQILESPQGENFVERPEEKKIFEINRQIKQVIQKTVELDKRLNMRIAGKDSFYNQRK